MRRTTIRQIDVPAERHVRMNITLKLGHVSKNRNPGGLSHLNQWRETCACLHVDITDEVKLANSQYLTLTFHVEGF